jgi:hypothetical protein
MMSLQKDFWSWMPCQRASKLDSEKYRVNRQKRATNLRVRMHNSMCQYGRKATEKLTSRHGVQAPHLPDSPDLSTCDF